MKVLIVYHYIALYREPIFNVLRSLPHADFYFASSLTSNNDIVVVDGDSSIYDEKIFYEIDNTWLNKGFLWQKGILRILRDNFFDHVIFLGDPHFITTWLGLLFLKCKQTQTHLWTHGFLGRSSKFQDYLKLKMYSIADGVLLYGDEAKSDLIRAGVPESKLSVIYNSLDYNRQKLVRDSLTSKNILEIRKSLFANHNNLQLFFVGRLTKHKKLDMLIEATNLLKKDGFLVNVLFIGNGEIADELKATVKEYSLEKQVKFYGSTHDESELAGLICSSDMCVAPGEIGLTAMHSLAYGIPIITHNNKYKQMPEYEAVIDNDTGLLFEYNSIDSLVDKIKASSAFVQGGVRDRCISVIESKYNPETQAELISNALGLS